MLAQHPSDAGGRGANAQFVEFTLDTHTAPSWILSAQATDQLYQFWCKGPSAAPALFAPTPPLRPLGFSVPSQQRVRANQERPPPDAGQPPAERSEYGSVNRAISDTPAKLAFEYLDLMAKDQDL